MNLPKEKNIAISLNFQQIQNFKSKFLKDFKENKSISILLKYHLSEIESSNFPLPYDDIPPFDKVFFLDISYKDQQNLRLSYLLNCLELDNDLMMDVINKLHDVIPGFLYVRNYRPEIQHSIAS